MQQVKIFGPAPKADLESELNTYLAGFHQAAKAEVRVSLAQVETEQEAGTHETFVAASWFYAVVTVESVRRDLASEPSTPKAWDDVARSMLES